MKSNGRGLYRRVLQSALALCLLLLSGHGARLWAQAAVQAQKQSANDFLPASIHGLVANKDGELYEGARVTLTATGAAPARTQATDSGGAFNFSGVPVGAFTLTVSSIGFATQTVSGTLRAGEVYDAKTIVLPVKQFSSDVQVTATQQEIAVEQFHEEEQQRVLGVIPNFFVAYAPDAPPLTARQKYSLAWKSSIDPVTFLAVGALAGIEQAGNEYSGYGQGAQGYGKRYGAGYADAFINTMLSGAVLPAAFKQDPRYFYKGTGTVRSRIFYALASSVICRGDNGRRQLDYSGILGGLAAGGISNLYYPAGDRNGVGLTFENTALGTAGNAIGNIFQEFVVRKLTPKLPHYGQSKP